ncbi:MAG TPA: IS3 family transposase [Burkholderiales bacterium]|nr:IS3 family transposase [Burkholderiales bacterium]
MTADVSRIAGELGAPVAAVCRALQVPRSTAYARRGRPPSPRMRATAALDVKVRTVHAESHGRYGSPRVHQELARWGHRVGRKRVEARMRALGLVGRRPRRFRRTTEANPAHCPAPNLLDRRFQWAAPNRAWVGDITYVWTLTGWAYLALLVDLCTRRIVGWALSTRCDTELALRALDAAVARHRPEPGLLHHTDRGSTYTSADYRERLKALGFVESMSRKGNCFDNAVAESTIGTIKAELLDRWTPADVEDIRRSLFPYIEGFYNRRRLHSSLGYRTPVEREFDFVSSRAVA